MDEDKLIIFNRDGSKTIVEDPFRPIKAVYDALRKDPAAMPELSEESRAAILAEIANGTAPTAAIEADSDPVIEADPEAESVPAATVRFIPNRHDRRERVERGILTLEGCLTMLGAVVAVYGLIYLVYLLIWN
ncbi:MAG TPA: hypothetical protein DCZ08_00375 [Anaerolineaceae bacterium]|nr:hypothetical protein [Anaerolineaceae bacterium]